MNEPLELRVNRSTRVVLAWHPSGAVLEIQSITTLRDGHGWHVMGQCFLEEAHVQMLRDYLGALASSANLCKGPQTASETGEKTASEKPLKKGNEITSGL